MTNKIHSHRNAIVPNMAVDTDEYLRWEDEVRFCRVEFAAHESDGLLVSSFCSPILTIPQCQHLVRWLQKHIKSRQSNPNRFVVSFDAIQDACDP